MRITTIRIYIRILARLILRVLKLTSTLDNKQELPKKEPTPAMQLGGAVHAFILEPNKGEFVRGEGSAVEILKSRRGLAKK